MLWVVLAMAIAFLLAAPYTLLDLPEFLNGFARLASEYRAPLAGVEPVWMRAIKSLRIAYQWPGSLIVLTGLVVGAARIVTGPDRHKWALLTVYPIAYFFFVSQQNIFFARYLLPLVPSLSLLGAAGMVAVIDVARRGHVPASARQAVVLAVTLLAIVPPAYSSIQFNALESKVWTTEQAYRWILQTLPAGSTIYIEGSVTFHLPPSYRSTHIVQLRHKGDAASYKREGIQYLVASSQVFGPYMDLPSQTPAEYGDYVRLFRETKELARFAPSREHPGPELRILQVP